MIQFRLAKAFLALLATFSFCVSVSGSPDDAIPPSFIPDGSYVIKNLDGTDPLGPAHGLVVGVNVYLDHYEECVAVYVTEVWLEPVGGGPRALTGEIGEILYDICEGGVLAQIESASIPGMFGVMEVNDDGTYTVDYSASGGNTRMWHPE